MSARSEAVVLEERVAGGIDGATTERAVDLTLVGTDVPRRTRDRVLTNAAIVVAFAVNLVIAVIVAAMTVSALRSSAPAERPMPVVQPAPRALYDPASRDPALARAFPNLVCTYDGTSRYGGPACRP